MSFSFSSLIRLIVLLAVGATIMAVGLSRFEPPKPGWRTGQRAKYANINEYALDVTDRIPRWLDTDTGRIEAYPPEDGDILESASCAPWTDEEGRSQVVGRWSSRTKEGPMSISKDFGLARYSFPAGKLLDHVSTGIMPVGTPCWFPGKRARVLFVAGDGMLYHYAFEPEGSVPGAGEEVNRDLLPRPLMWRCPTPGTGSIFVGDLSWPEDPRMDGRVVVSLRQQELEREDVSGFTTSRLWWLKLNDAGTEVVEAGRLLEKDESGSETGASDLRAPTVGTLANHRLVLAYQVHNKGEQGRSLRVAPIELEGERQVPIARESESLLLSTTCQPAQPSFSTDGRWLNAITGPDQKNDRVTRLSTASFFEH